MDDLTSIPSFRFRWDVFLSFRGEDTRHTFTQQLYTELVKHGVRTFRDDQELQRGEEIDPSLLDAIQDSAAAIAVISKRYANSRWCLEELARIIECRRLLLPVFYQVDPSNVRHQTGPFEEDFGRLEDRFGVEKVDRWRKAMKKASEICGWDSRLWEEQQLIESLVKEVLTKLSNIPLGIAKHPVGLASPLQKLMRMLDVKANGVKVLGIYGMGGAGKSTLAKALYNKLVVHFKSHSFISNIRENLEQENGLVLLQNRLIHDLSPGAAPQSGRGILSLREILHEEPALIVLDDIDDATQVDALIGKKHWFYEGSRIIITTRDKQVLPESIADVYEMNGLNFPEALQLFCFHAFGREKPLAEFADISKQIVYLTGTLPLALEVFGSFFSDKRTKKLWTESLRKLEQIPPHEIQEVLEISFNGLDDQQKCVFLDLACFFVRMRMKREDVVLVFRGHGFSAEILIRDLAAKSLIRVVEDDVIWMHDQLRDMGRQIVQRESPDLGLRTRLWDYADILNVLKNKKGTRSIQGISLDIRKKSSTQDTYGMEFKRRPTFTSAITYMKEIYKNRFHHGVENGNNLRLRAESFKQIVNLRLLQLNDVKLDGSFKHMPTDLKFLQWKECSLRNLPSEFCMQHLAVLDLSKSKIRKLWDQSWCNNKRAERLLFINLQDCCRLTDLPDLSVHSALEKLILENCVKLVKIHKSVGDLKNLIHLNLKNCENLTEFPSDVSGLKHLETLDLSGCLKLKELPDMRSMQCLRELLIDMTEIVIVPDSIFHLRKLERFSLKRCQFLRHVPAHIGKLSSLKELSFDGSGLEDVPNSIGFLPALEKLNLRMCKSLNALPDSICNLKSLIELFLDGSSIKELPASIGSLCHLKRLSVSYCRSLSKLPDSIGGLASLVEFWLGDTLIEEIPYQVGDLRMLEKLYTQGCTSLRFLPESIGRMLSITTLVLNNVMITELPESIGMLESLTMLNLNECSQLQRLPASIGKLKSLQQFLMKETSVSELPDEVGMLSSLSILKMGKKPHSQQSQNHGSVLPKSLSNLSLLEELDACAWKFSGDIPDEFEKISSLRILNLSHNDFCSLPSSLRDLSILKDLFLAHCKQLKSLPLLPSSLLKLNVANCTALEGVCDLENLEHLQDLDLSNCSKIIDIQGLECRKSLRRLYMTGCVACLPAIKQRLAKVALKRLFNLSIPGRVLPDWFVQEIPRFSTPKNRDVKGMIIGIVLSLDQQTRDDFRDNLPAIVDVQAKIFRLENPIFRKTLNLRGVPNTDEDQLYLCRFMEFNQMVFMLEEGDKILIALRDRPYFNGLRLKKYGIHLIFENDDDIEDDDEELLDKSQWSVSWKLAKFIGSLE